MNKSAPRVSRWTIFLAGTLCAVILIALSMHKERPSLTGHTESRVVYFKTIDDFFASDIVSHRIKIDFDGSVTSGSQSANREPIPLGDASLLVEGAKGERLLTTISGFHVPKGAQVAMLIDENAEQITLRFSGPEVAFILQPGSEAEISLDAFECDTIDCESLERESPIVVTSLAGGRIQISLPAPERPVSIGNRIAVSELSFWEPQRIGDRIEKASGVLGGMLIFKETPDKFKTIHPGEIIGFLSEGMVLRSPEFNGSAVHVQYSGKVIMPQGEIADETYHLGPTYFDEYSRKPWVQAASGVTAFVLGSAFSFPAVFLAFFENLTTRCRRMIKGAAGSKKGGTP